MTNLDPKVETRCNNFIYGLGRRGVILQAQRQAELPSLMRLGLRKGYSSSSGPESFDVPDGRQEHVSWGSGLQTAASLPQLQTRHHKAQGQTEA